MGNLLLSCGSASIDCFGFGVKRNKSNNVNGVDVYDDDNGNNDYVDKNERVIKNIEEMERYCKPLIFINFKGQTSSQERTDKNNGVEAYNIGILLRELDVVVRLCKDPTLFDFNDPVACALLQNISDKRYRDKENQVRCYKRLRRDAKRFTKIYRERAVKHPNNAFSEPLEHPEYWGTRQQLLSGKIICDWLCEEDMPPMDPTFGVLLNPTSGRVGPGDSGWLHNLLYDNSGAMAHHSAAHDAFGYLLSFHEIGPGYNYMYRSFLNKNNPLSGQISGLEFWKKYVKEVQQQLKVVEYFIYI